MPKNSSSLTVLFWNPGGLPRHLPTLDLLLLSKTSPTAAPHLLAFVETHWTHDSPPKPIHNYTWSLFNSPIDQSRSSHQQSHRGGGIALLHHHSIAVQHLDSFSKHFSPSVSDSLSSQSNNAAIMWHKIRAPHTPTFLLAICYIPPQNNSTTHCMEQCTLSIRAISATYPSTPLLILGDFNVRHRSWNDNPHPNDPRSPAAKLLASFISNQQYVILNNIFIPGLPTRPATLPPPSSVLNSLADTGSILDLAITDNPALVSNLSFEHQYDLHSDHLPLTLTLSLPLSQTCNTFTRTSFDVHNNPTLWQEALGPAMDKALLSISDTLNTLTQPLPPNVPAKHILSAAYDSFLHVLISTCTRIIGTKTTSSNAKHWFSFPGVKRLYHTMRLCTFMYKKYKLNPAMKLRHYSTRAAWKALVTLAKKETWHSLCNLLADPDNSSIQWTILKRTNPSLFSPLSSFPNPDNSLPSSHVDSLNNLTAAYVNNSIPAPCSIPDRTAQLDSYIADRTSPISNTLPPHDSDTWHFSLQEVIDQLTMQYTRSAPGPDTILPVILKHIGNSAHIALTSIYNFSWTHSILPQDWTDANVMSLYKNTGSRSDPSSYRPISITSIIIRSFEHLIHRRLVSELDHRNYFFLHQYGFRRQHCTYDAIHYLLSTIQRTCRQGKIVTRNQAKNPPCPVIFIDIKKAFDRVWIPHLMYCIEQAQITGKAWLWIHAFLSNRRIRTIDRAIHSDWKTLHYGVPQGCVLSPLLFLIYINSISIKISTQCKLVTPLLLADDKALIPSTNKLGNKSPFIISDYLIDLRQALSLLSTWAAEARVQFGASKTKLVAFCGRQHIDFTPFSNLQLTDFTVDVADSYTYLGITFHRKLTWQPHFRQVLQQARRDSYCITRIATATKHPHFHSIRTLCIGFIRARCTYGFLFWGNTLTQSSIRLLQSAFIQPLRRCVSLPKTTHQLSLFVEANAPSFTAFLHQLHLRWLYRSRSLNLDHPTRTLFTLDTQSGAKLKKPLIPMKYAYIPVLTKYRTLNYINTDIIPFIRQQQPTNPILADLDPITHGITRNQCIPLVTTQLALWITHYEWRHDPKHPSTAPLLQCKPFPSKSLYLYNHDDPSLTLRARLRTNRAYTQVHNSRFSTHANTPSPACTDCNSSLTIHQHSTYQQQLTDQHQLLLQPSQQPNPNPQLHPIPVPPSPPPLSLINDSVSHILLDCPRHMLARSVLVSSLASLFNFTQPLTVDYITNPLPSCNPTNQRFKAIHSSLLALTSTFLQSILTDRTSDPSLPSLLPDPG
ncbi:MAG: reverse transcriptase domain-containing protein [Rhabdochlamydiaceae bacterium]